MLNINGIPIETRECDGYVNGTDLCKKFGKLYKHWRANKTTDELLAKIEHKYGIPLGSLIKYESQISWVHPYLTVDMAYRANIDLSLDIIEKVFKQEHDDITESDEDMDEVDESDSDETEATESDNEEYTEEPVELLTLGDITLTPRSKDGYVNGTELCKALGKQFSHWRTTKETKLMISRLAHKLGVSEVSLIKYEDHGSKNRASWVDPNLAVDMLYWANVDYKLDGISKVLNTIGQETLEEELDNDIETEIIATTNKQLTLNGIIVEARSSDGYINGTALCKALGKRFGNWRGNLGVDELLVEISRRTGIAVADLIKYENHGPKNRASWIGLDLAIDIVYWSNSRFRASALSWLKELMVCGSVVFGQERTFEEIEASWKQQLKEAEEKYLIAEQRLTDANQEIEELFDRNYELTAENEEMSEELDTVKASYKKLEKNHTALLKKRKYPKFDTDNCFYMWYDPDHKHEKYKFGITDDINGRLRTYRVSTPRLQLKYLLYIEDNRHLEETIKRKFEDDLEELNHEIVIMDFKSITDHITKYLDVMMCRHKLAICDDTPWSG